LEGQFAALVPAPRLLGVGLDAAQAGPRELLGVERAGKAQRGGVTLCAIPALAGLTPDEAYAGAARFSTDAKKQKKQQQQNLAAHGVGLIAGIRSHPARL